MEFGIFTAFNVREGQTQHHAFREWLDIVQVAEEVGIDCVWLAEFHFRPQTVMSSPGTVAGAIAARTTRVRLCSAVRVLPLHNPLSIAEEAATLDHLSEGRFIFGIGRSSTLGEYRGYNIDYAESRERFLESLKVIRLAWGEQPFSFEGRYYQYHDVDLMPKPYQKPHPPIRVACESRDTFPMIGQMGFPIMIRHQLDALEIRDLLQQYERERHTAGFLGPSNVTLQTTAYVAESAARARADIEPGLAREALPRAISTRELGDQEAYARLSRGVGMTYDDRLQKQGLTAYPTGIIAGPPQEVVERLQEYQEAWGITGVALAVNPGGIPYERIVNSLRLMGDKVIPHFK